MNNLSTFCLIVIMSLTTKAYLVNNFRLKNNNSIYFINFVINIQDFINVIASI